MLVYTSPRPDTPRPRSSVSITLGRDNEFTGWQGGNARGNDCREDLNRPIHAPTSDFVGFATSPYSSQKKKKKKRGCVIETTDHAPASRGCFP